MRENGKLEKKNGAESLCPKFYSFHPFFFLQCLAWGFCSQPLYQIRKITSQIFLQSGQKRKKNKRDQKAKTNGQQEFQAETVRIMENSGSGMQFRNAPFFLHFLLFFPSGLLSAMLSLTQILRAWIYSAISA